MENAKSKEEIIALAISMGFTLNYDKWINNDKSEYSNGEWLRFIGPEELDEQKLRWIWYKTDTDEENIERGIRIQIRLKRKKEILDFLKY